MTTIRDYRLARGWTQQQLAAQLGTAVSTVYSWEKGARTPAVTQLRKLAATFGVLMDDIELVPKPLPDASPRPRGRPRRPVPPANPDD